MLKMIKMTSLQRKHIKKVSAWTENRFWFGVFLLLLFLNNYSLLNIIATNFLQHHRFKTFKFLNQMKSKSSKKNHKIVQFREHRKVYLTILERNSIHLRFLILYSRPTPKNYFLHHFSNDFFSSSLAKLFITNAKMANFLPSIEYTFIFIYTNEIPYFNHSKLS